MVRGGGVLVSAGNSQDSLSTNRRRPRARIFAIPAVLLTVALGFAVFASVGSAASGTCTINWTGAASSDWGTASNWTVISSGGHRVPISNDFVCMAASPSNTAVDLGSGTTSTIAGINWPAAGAVQPSLQVDGTLTIGNNSFFSSTLNQLTDNGTVLLFKSSRSPSEA